MLRTLMMRPQRRSFICGKTSRQKRICANSLRSRSACHISSVNVSEGPRVDCPALLTKMSTLPNSDMIWSYALRMSATFDTSQLIAATLRPGAPAWILALARARVPGSRARIATSAPDLAYSSAIARPSPLLPPVTMALLPSNRTSMSSLLLQVVPAVRRSADRAPAWVRLSRRTRRGTSTRSSVDKIGETRRLLDEFERPGKVESVVDALG